MDIVILDGYTLNPGDISWDRIKALGKTAYYDYTAPSDTVSRIGGAEIVLTNKTVINKEVMDACPSVKYIGALATGYNAIDTEYAKQKGITVTNIPAYSTNAEAQFVFALLLELCLHVGEHDRSVKAGDWTRSRHFCYWLFPLKELYGKTIAVIGYGRIGKAVGRIAQAFGMKVLAYAPSLKTGETVDGAMAVTLEEAYKSADVLSLNCPLTKDNQGMINAAAIAKMKPSAFIINTGRGPLINEKDLAEALNSGRIAGAAADVLSKEPPIAENPLLSAKNCIITPHIAWGAKESRERLMNIAADNIEAFLEKKPINVVNK